MVEIKHLCLCLLFSSTHFSVYKDTFAFYKDTKCVQGHAILMPDINTGPCAYLFQNFSQTCFSPSLKKGGVTSNISRRYFEPLQRRTKPSLNFILTIFFATPLLLNSKSTLRKFCHRRRSGEIFKIGGSEITFPAFWEHIW